MRAVPTPEQEMLRTTAQRLAGQMRVNTPGDVQKVDGDRAWQALADAGLLGMRVRDEQAPIASGFEALLAVEQLAGALAPTPFLGALLATELLALAKAPDDVITDIGAGRMRYGLALTRNLDALAEVGAADGAVCLETQGASFVLVLKREGAAFRVCRSPITAAAAEGVDLTRPLLPWKEGAALEPIGQPLKADDIARWTALALALVCADIVGALRTGLRQVVEYAKTRIQYDVPIGSFQAVQHMCAEMLVQTEAAASLAHYAAWAVDELPPAESLLAARTAKAYCAQVAQRVGEMLMQTYGGIGQTWEHVAHLRMRRVMLDRKLFGDEAAQLLHIADARMGSV